jgi:hypothetical protein
MPRKHTTKAKTPQQKKFAAAVKLASKRYEKDKRLDFPVQVRRAMAEMKKY